MVIKSSWKSEAEAENLRTGAKKNCELSYKKISVLMPKSQSFVTLTAGINKMFFPS